MHEDPFALDLHETRTGVHVHRLGGSNSHASRHSPRSGGVTVSPRNASSPSSPRISVVPPPSRGGSVITVSSLYSTAQCILSMVGSIGVILLFAGIPQLIYSPSVEFSNLMTFLMGASFITAMVAGNAFVNYKYRQYMYARNAVALQSQRLSREQRDAADKPPSYDELVKTDAQPPDYAKLFSQNPPRYEDIASVYQWGQLLNETAGCSSSSNNDDSSNNNSVGCPSSMSVAATALSPRSVSSSPEDGDLGTCTKPVSQGQANSAFESSSSDPAAADHPEVRKTSAVSVAEPDVRKTSAISVCERDVRKTSAISMGDGRHARAIAPVHHLLDKFKKNRYESSDADGNKSCHVSPRDDSKKSDLWNLRKVFTRSVSEGGFESLSSDYSCKPNPGSELSQVDDEGNLNNINHSSFSLDKNVYSISLPSENRAALPHEQSHHLQTDLAETFNAQHISSSIEHSLHNEDKSIERSTQQNTKEARINIYISEDDSDTGHTRDPVNNSPCSVYDAGAGPSSPHSGGFSPNEKNPNQSQQ